MTENVLTSQTDRSVAVNDLPVSTLPRRLCHISEDPRTVLGLASVFLSVLLPSVVGPLLTAVLYCGVALLSCSLRSGWVT